MPFIRAAFFLLQPSVSIQEDIMFSNTAITVENEANVINRKKSEPQILPPDMFTNTLGSVTKISPGP